MRPIFYWLPPTQSHTETAYQESRCTELLELLVLTIQPASWDRTELMVRITQPVSRDHTEALVRIVRRSPGHLTSC